MTEPDAAAEAWVNCECCVCHVRGIIGSNGFKSIWIGSGMMYAHRSCHTLANIFPDMRPSREWMAQYAYEHHMVPLHPIIRERGI